MTSNVDNKKPKKITSMVYMHDDKELKQHLREALLRVRSGPTRGKSSLIFDYLRERGIKDEDKQKELIMSWFVSTYPTMYRIIVESLNK